MEPLTHHEMIALAEPFARRGRHVDLPATDRAARRLAFRPVQHEGFTETLLLEPHGARQSRLVRRLDHASGLRAELRAEGADIAALLAAVEAVPPASQFAQGPGWQLAFSERLSAGAGGTFAQRVLVQGTARAGGLLLTLAVSAVSGVAGEITLAPAAGTRPALPQDLLAVLGWSWARLLEERSGWRSRVKLARREPARTADAKAKLERAAAHLAQTLHAPPAGFHERFRAARWGVVLRRAIPVLTLVLLALGLWVISRFAAGKETGAWVLLIHVPTLMLAIGFRLQELAQFEIPPLPQRLAASAWAADQGAV